MIMTTAVLVTRLKRFAGSIAIVAILPVTALMASGTDAAASARPDSRPEPTQPEEVPEPVRTATLEVVSGVDGSLLPGATAFIRGTGGRVYTWEGRTDDQGRYTIVPPSEATFSFEVVVATVGYVPGYVRTVSHPAPIVVKLEPVEAIGGIVRDERGRPIEGARVFPMIHRFARVWPEIEASPNGGHMIATTDARGRWRSDALPIGTAPDAPLRVRVTHADHAVTVWRTTAREARAFSSVQVMRAGGAISGTVLGPSGRPVRGATVVVAPPPWDWEYLRLTTDEDGRFRSGRCLRPDWSTLVLVVQAPGLAWAVHEVAVTPEMPPQVIRLSRRRPLEGRVVDAQARPVARAVVASHQEFHGGLLGWEAETDAAGRFVWYDAPTAGEVYLNVFAPSHRPASQTIARPGADEVMITLPHP
jgi:hypothetical protein